MAFDDLRMQIDMLLSEMVNEPADIHELREQVREILNEMRATGMPLPEDLVALEQRLEAGEGLA